MQPVKALFLDASVLVAAARSPSGGSALVLQVCNGRRFRALTTRRVLLEAFRNVRAKFGDEELLRFFRQITSADLTLVPSPEEEAILRVRALTEEKDVHVLAGALSAGADYLVSLDRHHIVTDRVAQAEVPFKVLTPGDFLQEAVQRASTDED